MTACDHSPRLRTRPSSNTAIASFARDADGHAAITAVDHVAGGNQQLQQQRRRADEHGEMKLREKMPDGVHGSRLPCVGLECHLDIPPYAPRGVITVWDHRKGLTREEWCFGVGTAARHSVKPP